MYAKPEGPKGRAWDGGSRGEPLVDGALVLFPQYPQPLVLSSWLVDHPRAVVGGGVRCSVGGGQLASRLSTGWIHLAPSCLEPGLASVSSAVKREQATLPCSVPKSVAKPQ